MMPDEYLKKLEKKLKKHIPQNDVRDILTDYREFFQNGISDGKSQQELICEFGEPEILAETIVTDYYDSNPEASKRFTLSIKTFLKKSVLFAILCIIGFSIYATSEYLYVNSSRSGFIYDLNLQYPQTFIIVGVFIISFSIVGFVLFDYDKYYKTNKKVNHYKIKLILSSIPFLYYFIRYIPYLHCWIKAGDIFSSVEFTVMFIGRSIDAVIGLFMSLSLVLCLYSAQHKSILIVAIYPLLGAISSALFILGTLAVMFDEWGVIMNFLIAPIPIVMGFVFMFIALPILSKRYGFILNLRKGNNSKGVIFNSQKH